MNDKKLQIEVCDTRSLASIVADEIVATVSEVVSEKGSCALVLSGGSSPGAIYRTISRPPRVSEVEWNAIRIYWGDERWVSHDDSQSNYRMAHETLLSNLPSDNMPSVYGVDTSLSSPADGAKAYDDLIRKEEGSDGKLPSLDIVLLGMGEDGHFASIFPGDPQLEAEIGTAEQVCCVSVNPNDKSERVSLTVAAILEAKNIFFIIKGENKAETLKNVLEGEYLPSEFPAAIFRKAPNNVRWFVDSAAAQHLETV